MRDHLIHQGEFLHSLTLRNEPTPWPVISGLSSSESQTDDRASTSTSAVDTLSGKLSVDNRIMARNTLVYIFLCSIAGSPKCIVRDKIVVPSAYWPPESRITGSLSVIIMFVSLNVSKCGIDECGPNATVVLNDSP